MVVMWKSLFKTKSAIYPSSRALLIKGLFAAFAISSVAYAKPGIEVMPIAVWQGKQTRPWSVSILRNLRKKFPNMKIAHAVSAAPMLRGGDADLGFRLKFARLVQPGDDVLLHVAPWKSVVEKANIKFRIEPTVFGIPVNLEDCAVDCGLDLSVSAFSAEEVKTIVAVSQNALASSGFGEVKAVFFDEGVISSSLRRSAQNAGISEDWSGIELSQLRANMMRFPIYKWNLSNSESQPIADNSISANDGLNMDHLRFGVQAELSDLESVSRIVRSATEIANKANRTIRIPIVFNVEDLVHTHSLLEESIQVTLQIASEMSVPVRDWTAKNSMWNSDSIRRGAVPARLAATGAPQNGEAEFVSDDERLLSIELAH